MTGAGMGGCAIALVDAESVEQVIAAVQSIYHEEIGYEASFYIAQAPGIEFEVLENDLELGRNTIKLRAIGVNKDHIWYN